MQDRLFLEFSSGVLEYEYTSARMFVKARFRRLSSSTTMQRANQYRDVNVHNKLSLTDQMRVIQAQKTTRSLNKLAGQFNCSSGQIRWIIKCQDKIIRKYDRSVKRTIANLSVEEKGLLLEKILYEWVERAQCHIEIDPITNETLMKKAQEALQFCCIRLANINLDWVLQFRRKFNIADVDMTMLRITNDESLPSLDLQEIIYHVLDGNPIFIPGLVNENHLETLEMPESLGRCQILNDEQAKQYLKPLEDYVLMRENYRAIGLISQLEAIFSGSCCQ